MTPLPFHHMFADTTTKTLRRTHPMRTPTEGHR
jgi:hypothetical protein